MTDGLPFTKAHGLGNDYVFLDGFETPALAARGDLPELAARMSDRRTGVGADGLIVFEPCPGAAARMRIYNADGSLAQRCGNGLRCVARLLVEHGHALAGEEIVIETGGGPARASVQAGDAGVFVSASVGMGAPSFNLASIGVDVDSLPGRPSRRGEADEFRLADLGACVFVGVGNPHLVAFTETPVNRIDLASVGPAWETHCAFPDRINVHVVNVASPSALRMRSWERGAGLTRACGTGACAALVAGAATGRCGRSAEVSMPGGALRIDWDERTDTVTQTGGAEVVFSGVWAPSPPRTQVSCGGSGEK